MLYGNFSYMNKFVEIFSIEKNIYFKKNFPRISSVNSRLRSRFLKFPDSPGCQVVKVTALLPNLPDPWELRLSAQFSLGTPFSESPYGLDERHSPRTRVLCDWLTFRPALRDAAVWADVGPVPYQPINV